MMDDDGNIEIDYISTREAGSNEWVTVCQNCGASLTRGAMITHGKWHARLERIADKVGDTTDLKKD